MCWPDKGATRAVTGIAAAPTELLAQVLPDPALVGVPPRLNGDQRSDSCRHESKPTKDYEVKIHPGR